MRTFPILQFLLVAALFLGPSACRSGEHLDQGDAPDATPSTTRTAAPEPADTATGRGYLQDELSDTAHRQMPARP
jgi:hypothetical protein